MRIPSLRIYFVPPSKPYETTSGDVFEVIEIGCEEEHGDDEDEDEAVAQKQATQEVDHKT